MKSRILSILSALALILTACGGIDGEMSVQQNLTLKDRKGHLYSVSPGNYEINLLYKENKNRLIITFAQLQGEKTKIEVQTPEDFSITQNGEFHLDAADYDQNVDLHGTVTTTQTQTPERYERQTCTYEAWETHCQVDSNGSHHCSPVRVYRSGWQDIRYYEIINRQKVSAAFLTPGTDVSVATMRAAASWSDKVITYQGFCH